MTERTYKQQFWKDHTGKVKEKNSEITGTWDMPLQNTPSKTQPSKMPAPASVPKTGSVHETFGWEEEKVAGVESIDHELEEMFKEAAAVEPDTNIDATPGTQPESLPQNKKVLTPHVDVTSAEPPKVVQTKEASYYAMPSIHRYPLDGFHQIEAASSYFNDHYKDMPGEDRHEFAVNLVKRASAVGFSVSEVARQYGSEKYAPVERIFAEIGARADLLKTAEHQSLYDELKEKVGSIPPDVFARTLHEIDKYAGIDEAYDRDCMDPWFATFAKVAEEADRKDAVVIGNEYMTVPDLITFAQSRQAMVTQRFGKDFADELSDDPAAIFDSLPRDQKIVIMRMVNNSASALQGASTS